jgi:putative transposase
VRAKVVLPGQVAAYRWSSLAALRRVPRPENLVCGDWLRQRGGWADDAQGLGLYIKHLEALAQDEPRQEREGVTGLGRGWAIGTWGWMQALAKQHASLGLAVGLPKEQRDALRESSWQASLDEELTRADRHADELKTMPLKQEWKLALAETLRAKTGASISWLAKNLQLGGPATLRGYIHHRKQAHRETN